MTVLFANNALSTLAGAINASVTSASLSPGTGALFPSPTGGDYFLLTFSDAATGLLNEIVKVTARSGDVVTMVRAQEGTAAQSWAAGDTASALITAGALTALLQQANARTKLAAATNFYVRADGSDANTGLANTAGGAWLTVQHAFDAILAGYDLAGNTVTINVGAGTAFALATLGAPIVGQASIDGLIVSGAGAGSTTIAGLRAIGGGQFQVTAFKVATGGSVQGLYAANGGGIDIGAGFNFGACGGAHMESDRGGNIARSSNYTISGGAIAHEFASAGGNISASGITVNTSTPVTYSVAFASAQIVGNITEFTMTYTGSPTTGPQWLTALNGVVTTGGQLASLPGSTTGSDTTGGRSS